MQIEGFRVKFTPGKLQIAAVHVFPLRRISRVSRSLVACSLSADSSKSPFYDLLTSFLYFLKLPFHISSSFFLAAQHGGSTARQGGEVLAFVGVEKTQKIDKYN